MNKVIDDLQNEFKNEAIQAPMLFKDLAKVEEYIAESYKTRSFIELIQNADDALSTNFGVHVYDDFVIVGNNGRDFNIDDVKAICRSGSSNKVRGGNTIGYRGIGFKSVVNLAKTVYVLSGDINFMYNKELTKELLDISTDVPLIRIPHNIKNIPYIDEINRVKQKYGYSTIFLFDNIKENIVKSELEQFDKSSVLFLNSVSTINLITQTTSRKIVKNVIDNICTISENNLKEQWKIYSDNNKYDKIAFKVNEETIISANPLESVIHSFTPTTETSGGYFKMNGNFSTDPSRKNIDFDELSEESFLNCSKLISNIIIEILNGSKNYIGFFKPFTEFNNAISSNRLRTKLLNSIKDNLNKEGLIRNLRLKPEMLSMEDYISICNKKYTYIGKEILSDYPEINVFLELINIKYLSIDEMLILIEINKLSEVGLATILGKLIKKYRYDFSNSIINQLSNVPIFVTSKGQVNLSKFKDYSELNESYKQVLNDICDKDDIRFAFKKLGIKFEESHNVIFNETTYNFTNNKENNNSTFKSNFFSSLFNKKEEPINNTVNVENKEIQKFNQKRTPNIQKWRSTEINLVEYLKCFDNIETAKDVSISNLGYDIEVKLKNGRKLYIEVKSMISFSQPFKITNNEYTCAHNYGDDYYLALVINDDNFQVKFIQNPIQNLHFEKKCEQWSWFCEEYKNNLIEINDV